MYSDDRMYNKIYGAIDLDGGGGVDWDEFKEVFFAAAAEAQRFQVSWL